MPTRHHKKRLRDPDDENRTNFLKEPNVIIPVLNSLSKVIATSPAVITLENIEKSKTILFALENSQSIISFYNEAYERIIHLLDLMIVNADDDIIIDYAYSLRMFINIKINEFSGVPGNSANVSELEIFQEIILSVLQNIMDGFDYALIQSRLEYLQSQIIKYKLANA